MVNVFQKDSNLKQVLAGNLGRKSSDENKVLQVEKMAWKNTLEGRNNGRNEGEKPTHTSFGLKAFDFK